MNAKIIWTIAFVSILAMTIYFYQATPHGKQIKTVVMVNNNGANIGAIKLADTGAGVMFNIDVKGLAPLGEHAIHVHETGKCTPEESFKDAGGHFNPAHKDHGMKSANGQHAGDMPNLKPDKSGNIATNFLNFNITLEPENTADGKRFSVFDEDGSAIVIHALPDDHMSQPSGAAGDRIACGVIK